MKNSFLAKVAEELIKRGGDFSALNIVFPQRRAIEVFRSIWQKKFSIKDGGSPKLFTMSRLFRNASGLKKADRTDMLFRIYGAYLEVCTKRGVSNQMTFEEFLPWSEMMFSDFDDVDRSLADAPSVFREVNNFHDIDNMKFADEESVKQLKEYFTTFFQAYGEDMRGKYHGIWNMLADIYECVKSSKEKTIYEGAVYRQGCEKLLKSSDERKYVFVGFNLLSGAERSVMKHLKDKGCADFFWDYTPGFVDEDNVAVSNVLRNLKSFGGWTPPAEDMEHTNINIVESSTQSGEVAYISKWLEEVNPAKEDFTAIIPMDDTILGIMRHFLPHESFAFNMPMSLSHTSTFAKLMRFADSEIKKNAGQEGYDGRALVAALKEEIKNKVLKDDRGKYQDEELSADAAKSAVEKVETLLQKNDTIKVSPRVAAMIFKSQYISAEIEDEESETKFNSYGKRRVDVINLQDTRTIDFDNVLLLDCNEGSLPQTKRHPTMLPNSVRSAYGLPLLNNGSVAAYNFFRLLKRTPNISAAYSSSSMAIGSKEVSRYILQVFAGQIMRGFEVKNLVGKAVLHEHTPQPVIKTPQMLQKIKRLEATPLYMYVECPLKFYYNKVACLCTPMPDPEKMPSNLFGTIFHDSIQKYYEDKPDKHIERSTIEQDLADKKYTYLSACIKKAFNESNVRDNSIISGIILKYLKDVLRYDAAKAPFDIVPQYIEKFLYVPFVSKSGYMVKVGGKFDRVHIKDNIYVVVDYKTGKWSGPVKAANLKDVFTKPETLKHYNYVLQTMVYSLALDETLNKESMQKHSVRPELYFVAAMTHEDFTPQVTVDKHPIDEFSSIRDEVRNEVQNMVDDIFDISKPFTPCENGKPCAMCDYKCLCFR